MKTCEDVILYTPFNGHNTKSSIISHSPKLIRHLITVTYCDCLK